MNCSVGYQNWFNITLVQIVVFVELFLPKKREKTRINVKMSKTVYNNLKNPVFQSMKCVRPLNILSTKTNKLPASQSIFKLSLTCYYFSLYHSFSYALACILIYNFGNTNSSQLPSYAPIQIFLFTMIVVLCV